jgi:hypothetical protein
VHRTYRWVIEGDKVLGAVALRHELNDFLLNAGGHIGYGIAPRRGGAVWRPGRSARCWARRAGSGRVAFCLPATLRMWLQRAPLRVTGMLDDIRDTELGRLKRYWINLAAGASAT